MLDLNHGTIWAGKIKPPIWRLKQEKKCCFSWIWSKRGMSRSCLISFLSMRCVPLCWCWCCWWLRTWLLNARMRSGSTLWIFWTNRSARCACWRRQPGWTGVLAGFGPHIWRWGWWGQSANWRSHWIGRNWHVSKRRCRWTVTQCSHWMVEFACRPKLALSMLCVVSTSWRTLINMDEYQMHDTVLGWDSTCK